MFDKKAIEERRNALPKNLERNHKNEKQSERVAKPDQVYALAIGDVDNPVYFYVGISTNPAVRWNAHKKAISLGADPKQAYEFVRYHKLKDTCRMVILDPEGELTEAEWVAILIKEGYPLQNEAGGVDVKRKKIERNSELTLALKGEQEKTVVVIGPHYQEFLDKIKSNNLGNNWAEEFYKGKK